MSSFAASFTQGLMRGREEAERKRREAADQEQRGFQNKMATDQFDMSKFAQAVHLAQLQAAAQQGKVSESTSAGPGISAPTAAEAASPGTGLQPAAGGILDFLRPNAGAPQPPAMERIEPSPVRVTPSASQKALGMSELLIPILSKQQAERDRTSALKSELETKAAAEAVPITDEIAALFGGALKPGTTASPAQARLVEAGFKGQEDRKSREQIAAEREADRKEGRAQRAHEKESRASEKRTAMDVTVDAYVAAAQEGKITREALSQAGKEVAARVQTQLQKSGIKLLNNKEQTYKAELDDLSSLLGKVKLLYDPSYVGWADSKFPDFAVQDPKLATFRADVQKLFNQYAKARSGAAVTMPEELRLTGEIPSPKDNEVVFNAKLSSVIEEIEEKRNRLLGIKAKAPGGGPGGASRPPTMEELRKKYGY